MFEKQQIPYKYIVLIWHKLFIESFKSKNPYMWLTVSLGISLLAT